MKESIFEIDRFTAVRVEDCLTGGCGDGPFDETHITFVRNTDDLNTAKLAQAPLYIREQVISWHEKLFKPPQPQEQL